MRSYADRVMVMGRRGGATPHPATEPSAASSRFTPPASPKPSTLTRGRPYLRPQGVPRHYGTGARGHLTGSCASISNSG